MSEGVSPLNPTEWRRESLVRPPSDARFTTETSSQESDDVRMRFPAPQDTTLAEVEREARKGAA